DFAAGAGAEALPGGQVDAVGDEADRPVGHADRHPAGVMAAGVAVSGTAAIRDTGGFGIVLGLAAVDIVWYGRIGGFEGGEAELAPGASPPVRAGFAELAYVGSADEGFGEHERVGGAVAHVG